MAQPIKYEQLLDTEPLDQPPAQTCWFALSKVIAILLVSALRQLPAYVRRLSVTQSFPEFTEF
jgi:hypothetical protein